MDEELTCTIDVTIIPSEIKKVTLEENGCTIYINGGEVKYISAEEFEGFTLR